MTRLERTHCCVPGCDEEARRAHKLGEWMCVAHWRTVDMPIRAAYVRLRGFRDCPPVDAPEGWWVLWRQAKDQAIARSGLAPTLMYPPSKHWVVSQFECDTFPIGS